MNKLLLSTAMAIGLSAFASWANDPTPNHDCANSVTCNNGSINKDNISQDIVSNDNQYAPDSASASASVGDVIAQGGTGGNATATGNQSHNDNRSNAQIGANQQSNAIDNVVSNDTIGGSLSQGAITGGGNSQGDIIGGSAAGGAATGGNATGGNVTGGKAITNAGDVRTSSGVVGSGNSAARGGDQSQGQQQSQDQQQGQGQNQTAISGVAGSGNSRNSNSNQLGQTNRQSNNQRSNQANAQSTSTNVDASTRIKHSASTAYAPGMIGYGPNNCFGDTNPSGSFSAGVQTFGWGVTAGRAKASNVCAILAVGGQRAAAAYLANHDAAAREALAAAGVVQVRGRTTQTTTVQATGYSSSFAEVEADRSSPYTICEMRDGRPYIAARAGRRDEAVSTCLAELKGVQPPAQRRSVAAPTCPTGSSWDGKGCWAPNKNAVRR